MGENGKRYVEENYNWNKVEGKYLRLLERLSNKPDIKLLRYSGTPSSGI
jgi:hypothetical protein